MFEVILSQANSVNLFLTNLCNNTCPYCCAKEWITSDRETAQYMRLEDLDRVIALLKMSQIYSIRLLGGEPTLHPDLDRFVSRLLENGIGEISILTNGLGPTELYERILKMGRMKWSVNINNPSAYTAEEWELLTRNLSLLKWDGERDRVLSHDAYEEEGLFRLQLAIVFHSPDQDYRYIIELAEKYGSPIISFDISHPSTGGSNKHLKLEDLLGLKPTLLSFFNDCVKKGIKPNLGCVLPPCIFTSRELTFLMLFVAGVRFSCSPVMDIAPDLTVDYCFPMRGHSPSVSLRDTKAVKNFHQIFKELSSGAERTEKHCTTYCEGCYRFKQDICQGYCLRLKQDSMKQGTKQEESRFNLLRGYFTKRSP